MYNLSDEFISVWDGIKSNKLILDLLLGNISAWKC